MKPFVPVGKTRLLMVEGRTDLEFFRQLGFYLKFTKDTPLQIMEYEGKDNLQNFLALVQNEPEFKYVTHIGIVRDADFTGGAFQSVQSALAGANQENLDRKPYPIPVAVTNFLVANDLQVGVFIMPDGQSDGMLESLLLRVLQDDAIMTCVDDYFACIEKTNINPKPEPLPKATMRVYMAALYQGKIRSYIEGKNIDFEASTDDRNKSYLSDIYKMTWWTWEHEAFNPIKSFVLKLVE
jgi:hypothetical protein